MNHSCAPTCWFEGSYLMTATRDIAAGDEARSEHAFLRAFPRLLRCAAAADVGALCGCTRRSRLTIAPATTGRRTGRARAARRRAADASPATSGATRCAARAPRYACAARSRACVVACVHSSAAPVALSVCVCSVR
jgi:hypothetical protein